MTQNRVPFDFKSFVKQTADAFLAGISAEQQLAYSTLVPLPVPSQVPQWLKDGIPAHPKVLILAPHPDDECLMGGYALRMKQEWGAEVHVLPFSYGSAVQRQQQRKEELGEALQHLGFKWFDPRVTDSNTAIDLRKLTSDEVTSAVLALNPSIIFSPHERDGHATHQEAFHAARSAIQVLAKKIPASRLWVQTEFWRELDSPNILVPLSVEQVALLGEALSCHRGEIERNPYHLRLPAWYMDQVRRGSERVSGLGKSAVLAVFGQVYFQGLV